MMSDLEDLYRVADPLVIYVGPELPRIAGLATRDELFDRLLETAAAGYLPPSHHRELAAKRGVYAEQGRAFSALKRTLTGPQYGKIVEEAISDKAVEDAQIPELAKAIVGLRPRARGIITPNLDRLLERASRGELAPYCCPAGGLTEMRGWLLKLYGSWEDRDSWVLTSEEIDRVIHRDLRYGQALGQVLGAPTLFVATRLDDPEFKSFVERLRRLGGDRPRRHWALVEASEITPLKQQEVGPAGISLIGYADQDDCIRILGELGASAPPDEFGGSAPPKKPPAFRDPALPDGLVQVLLVAANPEDTDPLRLMDELRAIQQAIQSSSHRDRLNLEIRSAASIPDLTKAMIEFDPHILHISGHGEEEGLLLEGASSEEVVVQKQAFADLVADFAPPEGELRCVILNSCWSNSTAKVSADGVPMTVAMNGKVSDRAALEFARGFYDAIGAGRKLVRAYKHGRSCAKFYADKSMFDVVLRFGEL